MAKISIKYVLPTSIWKYFWWISRDFAFLGEFCGISRKYLNFAGPRPREISEALSYRGVHIIESKKRLKKGRGSILYYVKVSATYRVDCIVSKK